MQYFKYKSFKLTLKIICTIIDCENILYKRKWRDFMKEKNATKINLSTFLLIIAIIAIVIMSLSIYKLNNDKTAEIQKSTELQTQVSALKSQNNKLNSLQENNSNEITNNTVPEKPEKQMEKIILMTILI